MVYSITNSYISYTTKSNFEESDVVSQSIIIENITYDSNDDLLEMQLHLSLVFYDICNCDNKQFLLDNNLGSSKYELSSWPLPIY